MNNSKMMPLLLVAALASGGTATAAPGPDVVGAWKLVSVTGTAPDGKKTTPFGANPVGELHYTAEGRVMFTLSYGARPKLSVADRVTAPTQERADAFATHFDYAGSYSIADGKVTHRIEISSIENWVGTDLVRVIKLDGRRLLLTTPPLPGSGGGASNELVWERITPATSGRK